MIGVLWGFRILGALGLIALILTVDGSEGGNKHGSEVFLRIVDATVDRADVIGSDMLAW
jgi:hypothetical protein